MYLHKNGLRLRKFDKIDLPQLLELKNESWFGTHKISILNSSDQENWFNKITSSSTDLILIAMAESDAIGAFKIADIDWMNRVCHIGQDIFQQYRGKGFGYKIVEAGIDFCFEILNMNRLDAEVLENNIVSQKILFAGGFKEEGRRHQAVFKCNNYIDSLIIGITRNEWAMLPRINEYGGICNLSYKPLDERH